MSWPAAVFSTTEREVWAPSVNDGDRFEGVPPPPPPVLCGGGGGGAVSLSFTVTVTPATVTPS